MSIDSILGGERGPPTPQLIGYWDEGAYASDNRSFPDPHDLPTEPDPSVREAVARYLERGSHIEAYRGWSDCRFCKKHNGSTELGDGVWAWPDGLAHYVRDHHVALPREFVQHVLSNPKVASSFSRRTDLTFWKEWVKPYISAEIRNRRSAPSDPVERILSQVIDEELVQELDRELLKRASAVAEEPWLRGVCNRFIDTSTVFTPVFKKGK